MKIAISEYNEFKYLPEGNCNALVIPFASIKFYLQYLGVPWAYPLCSLDTFS